MERAQFRPPPDGTRQWQPPTERMRETGVVVDRQEVADGIKRTAADAYRSRTRYSEPSAFAGLKRAVDHALDQLRPRGMGSIADHLIVRIAHFYTRRHQHGYGMPAMDAFYQAVEDALREFVEQGT